MKVKHLLEAASSSGTGFHDSIAVKKNENEPRGVISGFEVAAVHLLTYDLVAKRKESKYHARKNTSAADIIATASPESSSKKLSIRNTGAHLRWHNPGVVFKVSKEKNELAEFSRANMSSKPYNKK